MKKILFYIINIFAVGLIGFSFIYCPFNQINSIFDVPAKYCYLWVFLTLIISLVLCFLEYKIEYYEKFFKFVINKRKIIITNGIIFVISALLSALAEYIIGHFIFGISSNGHYFNRYRYFFIAAIIFVMIYLVYYTIKSQLKEEKVFAVVALAAGFVMIFSSPFGHICWDAESHYKWALGQSNAYASFTEANQAIFQISDLYMPKDTAAENEYDIQIMNELDNHYAGNVKREISLPHLSFGAILSLGRLFGLSFYEKECLARLGNLLIYIAVTYFAIKKVKSGKMIFFVIALFPTNLFLATNIAYDWWVNAFMMLGVAYFIGEMQEPSKKITVTESVVMCGSLVLACLPKQIYFPILLLPFFMKKDYFKIQIKEKRKYILICMLAVFVLLTSFGLRLITEFDVGGDMRGGEDVSLTGQIMFILGSPFKYTTILLKHLWNYVSVYNLKFCISNMAYLGDGIGLTAFIIMVVVATLTDKNEYDMYSSVASVRIITYLITAAGFALVPTALYLNFTPVGSEVINGCQARYIIPLIIPFLPIVGSKKITNKMNRQLYILIFAVFCAISLFGTVNNTMITKML